MKKNLGCYILNEEEFKFCKNASIAYAESLAAMIKNGELTGDSKQRAVEVLKQANKFLDALKEMESV